jgi:hypothetical protein
MQCEKCNTEMIRFIEKSVQGVRCPNCGWSIITSYIEKVDIDKTQYSIFILHVTNINIEKIKLVAKIMDINYLEAKEVLLSDEVKLCEAKAPKIKKIVEELENEKIPYKVIPDFVY